MSFKTSICRGKIRKWKEKPAVKSCENSCRVARKQQEHQLHREAASVQDITLHRTLHITRHWKTPERSATTRRIREGFQLRKLNLQMMDSSAKPRPQTCSPKTPMKVLHGMAWPSYRLESHRKCTMDFDFKSKWEILLILGNWKWYAKSNGPKRNHSAAKR